MLTNRLRKNSEFKLVYQNGHVYRSRYFILRCLEKSDSADTRVGIAPSRKIRTAVERNKIKRRVRELYREYKHLVKDGMDLVFIIKFNALSVSFFTLKKDFEYLLKKSRLI